MPQSLSVLHLSRNPIPQVAFCEAVTLLLLLLLESHSFVCISGGHSLAHWLIKSERVSVTPCASASTRVAVLQLLVLVSPPGRIPSSGNFGVHCGVAPHSG